MAAREIERIVKVGKATFTILKRETPGQKYVRERIEEMEKLDQQVYELSKVEKVTPILRRLKACFREHRQNLCPCFSIHLNNSVITDFTAGQDCFDRIQAFVVHFQLLLHGKTTNIINKVVTALYLDALESYRIHENFFMTLWSNGDEEFDEADREKFNKFCVKRKARLEERLGYLNEPLRELIQDTTDVPVEVARIIVSYSSNEDLSYYADQSKWDEQKRQLNEQKRQLNESAARIRRMLAEAE